MQYSHLISNQHANRSMHRQYGKSKCKALSFKGVIKHYCMSWLHLIPVLIFSKRRIKRLSNLSKKWSQVRHLSSPIITSFIVFLPAKDFFLPYSQCFILKQTLKKKKSQILDVTVNINTTPLFNNSTLKATVTCFITPSWSPLT